MLKKCSHGRNGIVIATGVRPEDCEQSRGAFISCCLFNITVKLRAVDRSTIQFWNFWAKGHSTELVSVSSTFLDFQKAYEGEIYVQ